MGDGYGPTGRGNGRRGWEDADGWARMHDGIGWGGWLLMILLFLVLVAVIVGVVLLLTRSVGAGPGRGQSGGVAGAVGMSAAQQTLDERYARGEIEEEEYLRRRSVLRGGG